MQAAPARHRLPLKYNQKLRFHHNKYLNQTSGPLPIIRLICRESKSSEILVRTLLYLLQGQYMCFHFFISKLAPWKYRERSSKHCKMA